MQATYCKLQHVCWSKPTNMPNSCNKAHAFATFWQIKNVCANMLQATGTNTLVACFSLKQMLRKFVSNISCQTMRNLSCQHCCQANAVATATRSTNKQVALQLFAIKPSKHKRTWCSLRSTAKSCSATNYLHVALLLQTTHLAQTTAQQDSFAKVNRKLARRCSFCSNCCCCYFRFVKK